MYIAVAQINPTTGALRENATMMLDVMEGLARSPYPPDLVVFPAFALTGCPLDGMAFFTAFAAECLDVTRMLIAQAPLPCLFGSTVPVALEWGSHFVDADVIYCKGGVGGSLGFSEEFAPHFDDISPCVKANIDGVNTAIMLGEYPENGTDLADCDLIVVLQAKDYRGVDYMNQSSANLTGLRMLAQQADAWLVVANLVGAQDDLIFDGGSLVINPAGSVQMAAPVFTPGLIECNLTFGRQTRQPRAGGGLRFDLGAAIAGDRVSLKPCLPYEATWRAITLATRDYVMKNGFTDVVIGLSGGIDSALTAALATDALGANQVHGVIMPSAFSADTSRTDALELAERLNIHCLEIPINAPVGAVQAAMQGKLGFSGSELANQNLQARMRMVYLMHLSNSYGWLLLNTGNKSETATGFSTLYGDTAGAYAPFGNVYKTEIYELARWRNQQGAVIPEAIMVKPPSAELYAGQLDTDSLPPYEVLDRILRLHIEDRMGVDQIVDIVANTPQGDPVDPELVERVLLLVRQSEFKRRQEPMAPRIGNVDMTTMRNWPVTNGFIDHFRNIKDPMATDELLRLLRSWRRPDGWGFMAN